MRTGVGWAIVLLLAGLVLVGRSSAAFPGDNGKIAWASARNGNYEIYSANPDGSDLARLTTDPAADTDPAWSKDGQRIAFTSNRSGNDGIWVMSADGSGQTRLTTDSGRDVNPAWSPGGRNLVFSSTRDGDAEIFVMNEDGTGQAQLTHNDSADATPAWSPDGTKIAFMSERDGNQEIYVMNVDGSNQTRLTNDPGQDFGPNWSPDGKQIVFTSTRDGNYEIYVMNADGSDQHRLTTNLDTDLDPVFSPDGTKIAFTTNRDANNEIYVMNADGSNPVRFTASPGEDTTADWQAIPIVPPPPKPLTSALLTSRWRESEYHGSLVVAGVVPGPSRLRLVLRRGNAVRFTATLSVPAGPFERSFRMSRDLQPGPYVLDITAPGSPTPLSQQTESPILRAPPEGVVSQAWVSNVIDGPPIDRFPSNTTVVYSHFRFAAFPRSGRAITTAWQGPSSKPPIRKPRTALVISFLRSTNGVPFYRGLYTCVLRAGPTIVKRVSFRIG
jgi:Tol biopolymer transport system component